MPITTYNELQAAISSWLDRDDLSAFTPDFITLAEARMSRELRLRVLESRANSDIDDQFVDLPPDFAEMRRVQFLTDPIQVLEYITPDVMATRFYKTSTGRPRFYTIHSQLELNRVPDATYTMQMLYYKKLEALDAGTACNIVLANYPELYLYASLVESAPFVGDDPRLQMWETMYKQRLNAALVNDENARHGSGMAIRYA